MDGRCKTCKAWDKEYAYRLFINQSVEREGWGICWKADNDKSPIAVQTESKKARYVITAPDFGCVQWEAKE